MIMSQKSIFGLFCEIWNLFERFYKVSWNNYNDEEFKKSLYWKWFYWRGEFEIYWRNESFNWTCLTDDKECWTQWNMHEFRVRLELDDKNLHLKDICIPSMEFGALTLKVSCFVFIFIMFLITNWDITTEWRPLLLNIYCLNVLLSTIRSLLMVFLWI